MENNSLEGIQDSEGGSPHGKPWEIDSAPVGNGETKRKGVCGVMGKRGYTQVPTQPVARP